MKPKRVYALILLGKLQTMTLTRQRDGGLLTLPGGFLLDGEDEETGLRRLVREQVGYVVQLIRSIGPRHTFSDGTDATAFEVEVIGGQAIMTAFATDHFTLTKEQAKFMPFVSELAIRRMISDGYSVMEPWQVVASPVPAEMLPIEEGIYCDPGEERFLVEDYLTEDQAAKRRQWLRLPLLN
jgi:8-oxo-dGTP pyrophosphatase MutT (NUDIX family)